MSDPRVAVIGAGYAGMAAAVELARANYAVTVFEASKYLGGRAREVSYRGTTLDNGQHILIGAYHETLRLMKLVGVNTTDALMRLPFEFDLPGQLHLKAARLPAPLHLAWGLVSANGLSWSERLAVVQFIHRLRQQGFKLLQDISVDNLLAAQNQSRHLVQVLWEPLCVAALNTPTANASAQVFLHVLRDSLDGSAADSNYLLPRKDLSTLFPNSAATFVEAHKGCILRRMPVRRLEKTARGYALLTSSGGEEFAQVVCAVPPQRLPELLANLPELATAADLAANFSYQPICTVYLQYPAQVRLPKAMLGSSGGLTQWAFDRGQLHGTPGMIAVVISAEGKHQAMAHDTLALALHHELVKFIGPLPAPLWHKVITEKRATFACNVGLTRPSHTTALPGLYLAGDFTEGDYPATLEGAVRSGVKCAKLILENT